jgi:NAD(P)-dependent dehydrogenase (short-subunit alcohol dehydrogenase family)
MDAINQTKIVITGAFGALGTATAIAACKQGAEVALIDLAAAIPAQLKAACAQSTLFLGGTDLSNPTAASTAIDAAAQHMSGIDTLINIAGAFRWAPVEDGTVGIWDDLYKINTKTALNSCVAGIPHLRKSARGSIVNIGANGALRAGAGMGPYASSKSAVHKLTESLAEELKASGITVNAVLPSTIDTPANRKDMPTADFATWVSTASLAGVILFLASAAARDITGALLPVVGHVIV